MDACRRSSSEPGASRAAIHRTRSPAGSRCTKEPTGVLHIGPRAGCRPSDPRSGSTGRRPRRGRARSHRSTGARQRDPPAPPGLRVPELHRIHLHAPGALHGYRPAAGPTGAGEGGAETAGPAPEEGPSAPDLEGRPLGPRASGEVVEVEGEGVGAVAVELPHGQLHPHHPLAGPGSGERRGQGGPGGAPLMHRPALPRAPGAPPPLPPLPAPPPPPPGPRAGLPGRAR